MELLGEVKTHKIRLNCKLTELCEKYNIGIWNIIGSHKYDLIIFACPSYIDRIKCNNSFRYDNTDVLLERIFFVETYTDDHISIFILDK